MVILSGRKQAYILILLINVTICLFAINFVKEIYLKYFPISQFCNFMFHFKKSTKLIKTVKADSFHYFCMAVSGLFHYLRIFSLIKERNTRSLRERDK